MERTFETDMEMTIQSDWAKMDKFTYCLYYKKLKEVKNIEEY